jgi:hypothetical protein
LASQGSDKLKAILAAAQEKARAAQAAAATETSPVGETTRVEALLDRNEALPDPRALARLYREKELVERLPEDEEQAVGPAPSAPPAAPGPTPEVYSPPVAAAAPLADPHPEPRRPPLSPAQIREVMNELQSQFPSGVYQTFEAKPLPDDVIPMPEEDDDRALEQLQEVNESFYILGALFAFAVVGVFVFLALNGPLRYRPPAAGPTPSPSASVKAR